GISSTVVVGDPFQGAWSGVVPAVAQPVPNSGIFIHISTPKHWFDLAQEPSWNPNEPRTFTIPLTLSTPFPAVAVKGSVQASSMPAGVSMQTVTFMLQPQGTVSLALQVSIDRQSQAWLTTNIAQPFSIAIAYQTVSPPFAWQTDPVKFTFTVYPSSQSWSASGSSGGVNCDQWVLLYSEGTLARSGHCKNANAYTAKVLAGGTLVLPKVVYDLHSLGWLDEDTIASTIPWAYGQTNYLFVRTQPLLMTWTKF